jgi:hypothetical protein
VALNLGGRPFSFPLGLGDGHALLRSLRDEVGLELGHHREHVEQQPANRIRRVIRRSADLQGHASLGEFAGHVPRVGE